MDRIPERRVAEEGDEVESAGDKTTKLDSVVEVILVLDDLEAIAV